MSELGDKQRRFTGMLGLLYLYAYNQGFQLTLGRGRVSEAANKADGGHENSLHLHGLAQDLNLYKDGKWLKKTEDHLLLGVFWEALGGTWGGRFNDGNHYSLSHNGMK